MHCGPPTKISEGPWPPWPPRQRPMFIGLTICAKMIGGGRPPLPEILDQSDRIGAKSLIFDLFSLVATQP